MPHHNTNLLKACIFTYRSLGSLLGSDGRTGYGSVSYGTRVCIWLRNLPYSLQLPKTHMWSSLPLLCSAALLLHCDPSAFCKLQHSSHRGQTCKVLATAEATWILLCIYNIYKTFFSLSSSIDLSFPYAILKKKGSIWTAKRRNEDEKLEERLMKRKRS